MSPELKAYIVNPSRDVTGGGIYWGIYWTDMREEQLPNGKRCVILAVNPERDLSTIEIIGPTGPTIEIEYDGTDKDFIEQYNKVLTKWDETEYRNDLSELYGMDDDETCDMALVINKIISDYVFSFEYDDLKEKFGRS